MEKNIPTGILSPGYDWEQLRFYQKANALYQLTYIFCRRFLPPHGDRTVDQMIQAARSGKQNIVEGIEDGRSSTEVQLRLINVARGSLQELREDYKDYLHTRRLTLWTSEHPRFDAMLQYCTIHNVFEAYAGIAERGTDEELCNTAITLCHLTDKMMCNYLEWLQKEFTQQGGIKERMHAARTGYRKGLDRELQNLRAAHTHLQNENDALRAEVAKLRSEIVAIEGEERTRRR